MGTTKSEKIRGDGSETELERVDRRIGELSDKLKFLKCKLKTKIKEGKEKTKAFKDASEKLDVALSEYISLVGLEDLHKYQRTLLAGNVSNQVTKLPPKEKEIILQMIFDGVYCDSPAIDNNTVDEIKDVEINVYSTNRMVENNIFDGVRGAKGHIEVTNCEPVELGGVQHLPLKHARKFTSCTQNRCFYDASTIACGKRGLFRMADFIKAKEVAEKREKERAMRKNHKEPPPLEYSLKLLQPVLGRQEGGRYQVVNLMKDNKHLKKQNKDFCKIGPHDFKRLLTTPGVFTISVDYGESPNTIGHGVMLNVYAGYLQDGKHKRGYEIKELLHDDNGCKLDEKQVYDKVQNILKYFKLRAVYQWFVKEADVKAGDVPQYLGEQNPHYCNKCKESKFECRGCKK